MKKAFLVVAIALVCTNNLSAKKIAGYYLSLSNDTVRVTFDIPFVYNAPEFIHMQFKIKYLDASNQKQILKPDMANGIGFEYEGKTFRMLTRKVDEDLVHGIFLNSNSMFLHLIKDGDLKLFGLYQTSASNSNSTRSMGPNPMYTYDVQSGNLLQKKDGKLFKSGWGSFKNDMVEYLSDCPELAKKIEDKVYKSEDIQLIVDEYNKTCTP